MSPDSTLIQARFKEAISAWIESAQEPGHFLSAVLENDLKEAVARGDGGALDNLPHIVAHLYNDAPAACWGSPANVSKWTGLGTAAMAGWRRAHP